MKRTRRRLEAYNRYNVIWGKMARYRVKIMKRNFAAAVQAGFWNAPT